MRRVLHLTLVAAGMTLAAVPFARAAVLPIEPTTYYFSGACGDCEGTATGQLTLVDYTRGAELTVANFVSFHYDATNLIPGGFTLVNGGDLKIGGSISDTLPRAEDFYVVGTLLGTADHQLFQTFSAGRWCTGYSCIESLDTGSSHIWDATPAVAAVPEPMSLALLGTGVLGMVAVRRRA